MIKPNLFGYGVTTKAIANKLGNGCIFYDDRCEETYTDDLGNTIHPSRLFDEKESRLEVTTPSLKPNNLLIQKAKNLMSEYDYVLGSKDEFKKPFVIWISGTNGKTTTTQMLTHLLKEKGAVSGGNIGTPLAELDENTLIWVLETSSFTLHHTHIASPDIYILLPITPDHLDWHGDAKRYEIDKLKPLLTMREGDLALVPSGLNLPKSDAWIVEYDNNASLERLFSLDASRLRYKAAFLQDALLSLAITDVLFREVNYELLNDFALDNHRQEESRDGSGRLWVNDSKATNIDATMQAIETYKDSKIHLIIGGDDKGVNLCNLMDMIASHDIDIYTIGSNSDRLSQMAEDSGVTYCNCKKLEKAMVEIDAKMDQDDIALLSPAASSLDQFSSYAKRGDEFKEFVKKI